MFEATPRLVTGRIVALQEQRFRLASDSGQVYLLTLGRQAPLDAEALADLHVRGVRVSVGFRGEPNLADGIAFMVAEAGR